MYISVYLFRILQASEADPNSLWEDEDTRSFYEGITDIKPFVPAVSHTPTINYIIIRLSCGFFIIINLDFVRRSQEDRLGVF